MEGIFVVIGMDNMNSKWNMQGTYFYVTENCFVYKCESLNGYKHNITALENNITELLGV